MRFDAAKILKKTQYRHEYCANLLANCAKMTKASSVGIELTKANLTVKD